MFSVTKSGDLLLSVNTITDVTALKLIFLKGTENSSYQISFILVQMMTIILKYVLPGSQLSFNESASWLLTYFGNSLIPANSYLRFFTNFTLFSICSLNKWSFKNAFTLFFSE